jgi:hypothetical protein
MTVHELDSCLCRLLADHTLPPQVPLDAFKTWLIRRERAAEDNPYAAELTADERICLRILNVHGQVYNGGIVQWVDNGYAFQFRETLEALGKIGARRLKRIVERAIWVLPAPVQRHLEFGAHGGMFGWLEVDARVERRLDRLTSLYYSASESGTTLDEHLLRFARDGRVRSLPQLARRCTLPVRSE